MKIDDLEKYSSAVTLSDMEIFVYPELMYSLVLANIMSPLIWRWREEETFKKLEGKTPYRKLMRMKQYIMDEFEFNLDLNTWGLTHKDTEIARFNHVLPAEKIAESNALFGYTGDQYYFDVDIRRHFGLDQYEGDIIPYWKTETVEAMNAFRLKSGYSVGAGECVSLSTLYAAAAFIICGIELEDIFMVLTPLHSQNFLAIQDGVITNNRRLVTKSMWFNGTEISNKAQRAIRNEQVTIVAHNTGHIHYLYDQATIDPKTYDTFSETLNKYLSGEFTALNFANFLRSVGKYQKSFQFCKHLRGERMYVRAETLFGYEHGSQFRIYEPTFDKLLAEVDSEDYYRYKITDRLCVEQLMAFADYESIDLQKQDDRYKLARYIAPFVANAEQCVADFADFLHINPRLPKTEKQFSKVEPIQLKADWSRQQVIDYLETLRDKNPTVDLAFYAYRDMTRCAWEPFIKAAIERNPVSLEPFVDKSIQQVYSDLQLMPGESIYPGPRLAQPDEVTNYNTGDGVEKGLTLANIIHKKHPEETIEIIIDDSHVTLTAGDNNYAFLSQKGLKKTVRIAGNNYIVSEDSAITEP